MARGTVVPSSSSRPRIRPVPKMRLPAITPLNTRACPGQVGSLCVGKAPAQGFRSRPTASSTSRRRRWKPGMPSTPASPFRPQWLFSSPTATVKPLPTCAPCLPAIFWVGAMRVSTFSSLVPVELLGPSELTITCSSMSTIGLNSILTHGTSIRHFQPTNPIALITAAAAVCLRAVATAKPRGQKPPARVHCPRGG